MQLILASLVFIFSMLYYLLMVQHRIYTDFMKIIIDRNSPLPYYYQVVRQVLSSVQSGDITGGAGLPSVRALAAELNINPNTVAKAYKTLEGMRVVHGAGRMGTFIADNASSHIEQMNTSDAKFELDELLESFDKRGMPPSEIRILLFDNIEKLRR